jgi:hypothetical protein
MMRAPFLCRLLISRLILLFPITSALAQSPGLADFVVRRLGNDRWQGSCAAWAATFTLRPAKSITTGSWRKDMRPTDVWAGTEVDSGYVDSTIEIEFYSGGFGVLRSQDGWYPLRGFSQSGRAIRFQVDTSQEVQPSELDRDIIVRAAAILSSDSVWNRADNRKCEPAATKWSIYCAMERATVEVTGGFHHRRPALQLVRRIVDERTEGRRYHHRLMDYNNDPSTRFDDVTCLFSEALARIRL